MREGIHTVFHMGKHEHVLPHSIKILCLMQRMIRVNVTTYKTNHTVYTVHDHYCVFFSKIRTAKLAFFNYPPGFCLSRWPRGLGRWSAATCRLILQVPVLPGAWMSVSFEYCVLSGRGLCVGPIAHPEESYWECCVWVWSWSLDNKETLARWKGC